MPSKKGTPAQGTSETCEILRAAVEQLLTEANANEDDPAKIDEFEPRFRELLSKCQRAAIKVISGDKWALYTNEYVRWLYLQAVMAGDREFLNDLGLALPVGVGRDKRLTKTLALAIKAATLHNKGKSWDEVADTLTVQTEGKTLDGTALRKLVRRQGF